MPIQVSGTLKKMLIIYTAIFVIVEGADQFAGAHLKSWFALIPAAVLHGRIWQVFTYSFLHADVMHLILNMMVLAFVGTDLEAIWGRTKFLGFYFYCITMAGLFYLLVQLIVWNPMYLTLPMVGASGGIYGLLLAYGLLFPNREMLFMMIFPMKAKQFVWLLAGIEFLTALFSGQGGLGALAHLSGMGAGFIYLWLQARGMQMRNKRVENMLGLSPTAKKKKNSSHLRLVKGEDDDDQPKTWH